MLVTTARGHICLVMKEDHAEGVSPERWIQRVKIACLLKEAGER